MLFEWKSLGGEIYWTTALLDSLTGANLYLLVEAISERLWEWRVEHDGGVHSLHIGVAHDKPSAFAAAEAAIIHSVSPLALDPLTLDKPGLVPITAAADRPQPPDGCLAY